MPDLTLQKITRYYRKLVSMAQHAYVRGHYDKCLWHLDSAAIIANEVNRNYQDEKIEKLLEEVSRRLLPKSPANYKPIENRFIFYDQIGNGTVLGLQYIRALKSWNAEFLYILDPGRHTRTEQILHEVRAYDKAQIIILNGDLRIRVKELPSLYNQILAYRAGKAFLHAPAEGAFGIVLWNALSCITRYRIVPGDHHFYIGTSVTDYVIEFRQYGITIALEKRGFRRDQILLQPYYPIIRSTPFEGFPEKQTRNRTIIISGGAFYKTYGRDDTYFRIIRTLADRHPDIVVLYAGGGDCKHFRKCIEHYNLENHLVLLGYRKDINEVIRHGNIYLGTYPFCGGLMSQYAAINGKPILQYTSTDIPNNYIEDLLGYNPDKRQITMTDQQEFQKYADKLIDNAEFRSSEGAILSGMVISPDEFNQNLHNLITHNKPYAGDTIRIDYQVMIDFYLAINNKYSIGLEQVFLLRYRWALAWLFPGIFFRCLRGQVLKSGWLKLRRSWKSGLCSHSKITDSGR